MQLAILIDPPGPSRNALSFQIDELADHTKLEFKDFQQAQAELSLRPSCKGFIITSAVEGLDSLREFLQIIRSRHKELSVLVTTEAVSLEDMRRLVSCGIDQILVRPFSGLQLKEKVLAAESFRQKVLTEPKANSNFEVQLEKWTPKMYKINLSGFLGEYAVLPELKPETSDATLFIDCERVTSINSIGVRSWALWFRSLTAAGFIRFEFENLHRSLLQQSSFVQGFLPPHSEVNSFYLYYYCDDTGEEKEFRVSRGKDFATDLMVLPEFREQISQGKKEVFEIDGSYRKLLSFYKGKIELS